jgi:PAS domain S-box-containing protein
LNFILTMYKDIAILLVEDNPNDVTLIQQLLHDTEYSSAELIVKNSITQAVEFAVGQSSVNVVLFGLDLVNIADIEMLRQINESYPLSPVVVLTQEDDEAMAVQVLREGAQNYINKNQLDKRILRRAILHSIERNENYIKLKSAYRSLQLSEQRFAKLFHFNPVVALALSTFEGIYIEVNEIFLKLLGYTREEVIGKHVDDLNIWLDLASRNQFVLDLKNGEVVRNKEIKLYTKTHRVIDVLFSMDIVEMENGPMIISTANDITDRVEAEKKLRESERSLDILINSSPDQIWLVDYELKLVKANNTFFEAVRQFNNITVQIGDSLLFTDLQEEMRVRWSEFYRRALSGEHFTEEYEENRLQPDQPLCFEVTLNPVYNEKNQVIGVGCFSRDITLRKQTERNIQAMNEQYEMLSRATNDAVWDWNLVDDIVIWNHGLEAIFGYGKEMRVYTGNWWIENIHEDDQQRVIDELSSYIMKGDTNMTATYRFRCANGTYKYVFNRGYILFREGKPVRMIGAMQDIDILTRANNEIRRLSMVASATDSLVIITDAEEKIEWVNESFEKLTGYRLNEIVGRKPKEILQGPETDRSTLDRIRQKLDASVPVTEEVLNYSKDGRKFWLKMSINPVFDQRGKLSKFISVETDVTIHKEYERKIIASAKELSELIENANAVILGIDGNGQINEWNKLAISVTGYTKEHALGKKIMELLIHPDEWKDTDLLLRSVLQGYPVSHYEFPIVNRAGNKIILLLSATPRRNSSGETIGLIAVGQDITELTQYRQSLEDKVKERTHKLEEALEKEKELVTLKSRFASMVSHEFRTPLATIRLSVNHIKRYKGRMNAEAIDNKIKVVQQQVDHMTHMLEEVLTLGRTEESKIQISKRKVNFSTFLEGIQHEVENIFKRSHTIHRTLNLKQSEIETDEDLLRNIFINLLSNAIKFSPGKEDIFLEGRQEGEMLIVTVRDQGVGIPEAELPKIFDPFHRGANVSTIQGTGLGLSIVKKAVDLVGGKISVSSNPGEGTVFTVMIPVG